MRHRASDAMNAGLLEDKEEKWFSLLNWLIG